MSTIYSSGVFQKTWGEELQSYKKSKTSLSWTKDEEKVWKQPRVTKYQKSREDRVFDPVQQVYRDNAQEQKRVQYEKDFMVTTLNNARVRSLRYGQTYDIINHRPYTSVPSGRSGSGTKYRAPREYNILSNLDLDKHHFAAPGQRPEVEEKKPYVYVPPKLQPAGGGKDYNIVSNRYIDQHEGRSKIDKERQKERAAQRFWETHDYNPVLGKFYDPEKEQFFENTRKKFDQESGKHWQERLPPSVKFSEGAMYDIVKAEPKGGKLNDRLKHQDYRRNRRMHAIRRARDQQDTTVHQHRARARERDARAINRISIRRFQKEDDRGYNIVNTKPFRGIDKVPHYKPRSTKKLTGWQRCMTANPGKRRRQGGGITNRGKERPANVPKLAL